MKVGRRRGRLCRRLVIKLTSCSSRHWHILQLNVMMGISHWLSLVKGISNGCRKNASFKNNEQIQCGLKTNVVMVRELFTKNNVNIDTFSTSFFNTSLLYYILYCDNLTCCFQFKMDFSSAFGQCMLSLTGLASLALYDHLTCFAIFGPTILPHIAKQLLSGAWFYAVVGTA